MSTNPPLRLPKYSLPIDLVERLIKLSLLDGIPTLMYARISEDRTGSLLGEERQLLEQEVLFSKMGLRLVGVYMDNDISAYSGKPRPDYLAMLDALRSGLGKVVTAWHTDRLHRSPIELEEYIAVCSPQGVTTHTVQAGPLDLSTPAGQMVARQLGAVARYESDLKAARQRSKKLQMAAAGLYRGGPRPYGWETDGTTPRPHEIAIIREMTERVLKGEGLRTLARELIARGEPTSTGGVWTQLSLRDVLMRARNAGLIERKSTGEIMGAAKWAGAVSEEDWRRLHTLVTDPSRRLSTSTAVRWLGSGIYLCGKCGDGMTTVKSGTSNSRTREPAYKPSYRCRASNHLGRLAIPIDRFVEDVIVERLMRPDALDLLTTADSGENVAALYAERKTLRDRLSELVALHAQGAIDGQQLAEGSALHRGSLSAIDTRIEAASTGSALDGVVNAEDVPHTWFGTGPERTGGLTLERRRAIIRTIATVTLLPVKPGRPRGGSDEIDPATVRVEFNS